MTGRRLVAWDARAQNHRAAAFSPWHRSALRVALVLVPGLLGALFVARTRSQEGLAAARAVWLTGLAALAALQVMRAPWRLLFHDDAALLARLPVGGGALHQLVTRRGVPATVLAALALIVAAVPLGLAAVPAHAGALAVTLAAAALLGPAATTAGCGIVVSTRAQRALALTFGEFAGPRTVWISFVPATAAMLVAALPAALAQLPLGAALLAGAATLAVAALAWLGAARLGTTALPHALRLLVALDAVRLAHVELDHAGPLEARFGRLLARGAAAPIYAKDVALARRRYPMHYIVGGAVVLTMWAGAAFGDDATRARYALFGAAALVAWAALFGHRLATPPIEPHRLLATLPVPAAAVRRAKRAYVAWRALVPTLIGVAPALLRAADPAALGLTLGAVTLVGLAAACLTAGRGARARSGQPELLV